MNSQETIRIFSTLQAGFKIIFPLSLKHNFFAYSFQIIYIKLGHKQALTSPCEGVQLINEVETPRLQGLAADEAKMFYL